MRKIVAVLLGCLVLAGCASDWQGEVRLKVTRIYDQQTLPGDPIEKTASVDLVGSMPKDAPDSVNFSGGGVELKNIEGEVKIGDEIICTAKQHKPAGIQTNMIETELTGCKKA
jgi:hypothetical protein